MMLGIYLEKVIAPRALFQISLKFCSFQVSRVSLTCRTGVAVSGRLDASQSAPPLHFPWHNCHSAAFNKSQSVDT